MKSIKLMQLKNGYRYNSDSLLLADFALNLGVKNELLDVGAGCGIIGILLKFFNPNLHLSLLDIQEENIKLIEKNLKENSLQAELFHHDFKDFVSEKKFDFIISNPPFYRQGAQKSENFHKMMSKNAEFLPLPLFLKKVNSVLKPRGVLYFCYEALALSELCFLLENFKLKPTKIRTVYSKKNTSARLLLIKAQKSSKSVCELLPPLFVCDEKGLSEEMARINAKFAKLESYDVREENNV